MPVFPGGAGAGLGGGGCGGGAAAAGSGSEGSAAGLGLFQAFSFLGGAELLDDREGDFVGGVEGDEAPGG